MSDNATLPATGVPVRSLDRVGVQTQVTALDIGGAAGESLLSAANPLPTSVASLPLPTGAATEATLATIAGSIQNHNAPFVDGSSGQIMLAKRRDADTTAVADGDLNILNMDENGRLKVSTQPASYTDGTGNITASAQTVFLNVDRSSNVTISMVATTLVGHNATFEYSNNSTNGTDGNWYGVQVVRSNANTVETATGVLAATPVYGWEASVNAYKWFRVRATAHTSGTAAYIIKQGTYATEPVPAIQITGTQPVSGTLTSAGTTTNTPSTPTASLVNSAATTNGTVIKATAGTIYQITASNTGAAAASVKFHNSATVTPGTTAVALTITIPAGGIQNIEFGSQGMRYGTGICLSITNLAADTDTTAVAANQVKVNTSYI